MKTKYIVFFHGTALEIIHTGSLPIDKDDLTTRIEDLNGGF